MAFSLTGVWARLVGGGGGGSAPQPPRFDAADYKGYRIRPAPYLAKGGYQTAGAIEKDFAEGAKEFKFIRAETHGTAEEAAEFAIVKGRQIIDQRGEGVFEPR